MVSDFSSFLSMEDISPSSPPFYGVNPEVHLVPSDCFMGGFGPGFFINTDESENFLISEYGPNPSKSDIIEQHQKYIEPFLPQNPSIREAVSKLPMWMYGKVYKREYNPRFLEKLLYGPQKDGHNDGDDYWKQVRDQYLGQLHEDGIFTPIMGSGENKRDMGSDDSTIPLENQGGESLLGILPETNDSHCKHLRLDDGTRQSLSSSTFQGQDRGVDMET